MSHHRQLFAAAPKTHHNESLIQNNENEVIAPFDTEHCSSCVGKNNSGVTSTPTLSTTLQQDTSTTPFNRSSVEMQTVSGVSSRPLLLISGNNKNDESSHDDSLDSLVSSLNMALDMTVPNSSTDDAEEEFPEIAERRIARRIAREQEESEMLARQLMEEEAIASYSIGADLLRENADQLSAEDFAAMQAALGGDSDSDNSLMLEGDDVEEDLSYDAMLRLSEQIGDVKGERWAMVAKKSIEALPQVQYSAQLCQDKDENDSSRKCLICQFAYEEKDYLRILPCKHRFHSDCVDQWLTQKDFCPYCRQSIVE